MQPSTPDLTPYPALNLILQELYTGVSTILGDQFAGLYLHGSLAAGDFNPGRSDVDFLVATLDVLPQTMVVALAAMHGALVAGGSHWAAELEGSYFSLAALRRYDPDNAVFPHVERYGLLRVEQHDSAWILQLHVLREHGIAIAGPLAHTLIDPIPTADLRRAARETLSEWWAPKLEDTSLLLEPGYQAYAVFTMCRILYTLAHGAVVSKPVAARWLQETAPRWAPLVAEALRWQHGTPLGDLDETLALIRYTLQQSDTYRTP
ncbi:MAG: DUF4111 domain-containing protein [Anaerolineae bacterium]|nr:DUF4111 domain-containing protein [Anaerolineae bacterium]